MNLRKRFEEYKSQRLVAKGLWTEIFATVEREHLVNAAKMLGIWEEPDRLITKDEFEFDVFTEFCLFNYKIEGKSPVERYALSHTPKDAKKRKVLKSGVNSKATLFLIEKIDQKKRSIYVTDLLHLEEEHEYMDFSMSRQPAMQGHLLFTRLLPLSPIKMLTGATMPFRPDFLLKYRKLYNRLGQKIKTKDKETRQFQIFWQLYQEHGIPMENVDITGGSR